MAASRRLVRRVEGPDRVDCVPGDAKPARQRGLDVGLAVRVLRDSQPQAPVERERPGHVRHDESRERPIEWSCRHPMRRPSECLGRIRTSPGCGTMAPWPDDPAGTTTPRSSAWAPPPAPRGRGGVRRTARNDGWVAEDPVRHLRPALDAWLAAAPDGPWQVRGALDGRDLARDRCHVAGRRPAPRAPRGCLRAPRQLRRARHVRDPACAEPETGAVVFEMATGLPDGRFGPHGHLVRLVVSGPVARRVADERRAIGDTAR